jgi:hypothetical protein
MYGVRVGSFRPVTLWPFPGATDPTPLTLFPTCDHPATIDVAERSQSVEEVKECGGRVGGGLAWGVAGVAAG